MSDIFIKNTKNVPGRLYVRGYKTVDENGKTISRIVEAGDGLCSTQMEENPGSKKLTNWLNDMKQRTIKAKSQAKTNAEREFLQSFIDDVDTILKDFAEEDAKLKESGV